MRTWVLMHITNAEASLETWAYKYQVIQWVKTPTLSNEDKNAIQEPLMECLGPALHITRTALNNIKSGYLLGNWPQSTLVKMQVK